ncbi:hypothetical protein [Halovalidus salilacus]
MSARRSRPSSASWGREYGGESETGAIRVAQGTMGARPPVEVSR